MTAARRLSLGDLYREMRSGLGDAGPARVSIEFRQRSSSAPVMNGHQTDAADASERVLQAVLDYEDALLQRASIQVGGSAPSPEAGFSLQRHGQGYAYSLDGDRWGRLAESPQIFDLTEFERELGHVPVRDATVEQAMDAHRLNQALDVEVDADGFGRLLRIFAGDRDEDADELGLAAFSVTIAGGEDVSIHYWWSLTGFERVQSSDSSRVDTHAAKVACSVSIQLCPLEAVERRRPRLDRSLPEVRHLDEVWGMLRDGVGGSNRNQPAGLTR